MKKKLWLGALTLSMSLCMAFGLAACDLFGSGNNDGSTGDSSQTEQPDGNQDGGTNTPDEELVPSEGLEFMLNEDGVSYSVIGIGTCEDTTIVIPSKHNGLPVTAIGYAAFAPVDLETEEIFESDIVEVVIPDCVTEIGVGAFGYCSSLERIVIPDSVISIGSDAFTYCVSLESVVIPDSVISIGYDAFYYCISLKSIVIPDSVTSIRQEAFRNCTSLERVVIGNSVASIGGYAFYECSSLESIVIPDSVIWIGNYAFHNCSSLESVVIGNSVTSIGMDAFYECSSLESIVIPDSVTFIGYDAFRNCSSLESAVIGNGVTEIWQAAFASCSSLESVYYKGTAEDWNEISIGSDNTYLTNATRYYYSETEPTEEMWQAGENYWHYDADMVPTPWVKNSD